MEKWTAGLGLAAIGSVQPPSPPAPPKPTHPHASAKRGFRAVGSLWGSSTKTLCGMFASQKKNSPGPEQLNLKRSARAAQTS